jgi:hypothetical protein
LADTGFQILLALLGGVIFGVFAEVAQSDSFLELPGDVEGEFVLERVELVAELLFNLFRHQISEVAFGIITLGDGE